MLNYYFDLYEDTLEAEANGQMVPQSFPPPQSCDIPRGGPAGDDLSRDFNRVMTFSSNLNPDAEEFVPGKARNTDNPPPPSS